MNTLSVPHRLQIGDGYCLPACTQMVLAYWGIERKQDQLAQQMKVRPGFGTRMSNITAIGSADFSVTLRAGDVPDLVAALAQGIPPILRVFTQPLPHWSYDTYHAVVLVGLDNEIALINDPGFEQAPIEVRAGDLWLAWIEADNDMALLQSNGK